MMIGPKQIVFRCDLPPDRLYAAADSYIKYALDLERREQAQRAQNQTGSVSWQAAREAAMQEQIDQKASRAARVRRASRAQQTVRKETNPLFPFSGSVRARTLVGLWFPSSNTAPKAMDASQGPRGDFIGNQPTNRDPLAIFHNATTLLGSERFKKNPTNGCVFICVPFSNVIRMETR
ncbi:MAG: hypothetical protein ACYDH9_27530 [Limisphaerales bacterium]